MRVNPYSGGLLLSKNGVDVSGELLTGSMDDSRIKPEPVIRPMTRGEVLYIVTTEHVVLWYLGGAPFVPGEALSENQKLVP